MSVNFFKETCKTSSNATTFGLCDDPPPAENPAYIDTLDPSKWIGVVENSENKEINFYATDHCVEILRSDGNRESKCDGILHFENSLFFIELKNRGSRGWLKKGREQITITIRVFKANQDISRYDKVEAYVCNKQRPLANTGNANHIQQFKDETGLILNVKAKIIV